MSSADAIVLCRASFSRAAILQDADAGDAVRTILAGCADLHGAAGCREGWRTAAVVSPDMRLPVAAAACAAAYCPSLPAPRPALCEHELAELPPSELGPEWAELERVVLAREHGSAAAELGEGLTVLARPVVVPAVAPGPAAVATATASETVTIVVRRDGAALVVARLDDASRHATLAAATTAEAAAALVGPVVAGAGRVVVAADASLAYQDVVRVLDALRTAGVTDFAIATQPDSSR